MHRMSRGGVWHEPYSPECLEKLSDNSGTAPIWAPTSAHNGPTSTISLAVVPLNPCLLEPSRKPISALTAQIKTLEPHAIMEG